MNKENSKALDLDSPIIVDANNEHMFAGEVQCVKCPRCKGIYNYPGTPKEIYSGTFVIPFYCRGCGGEEVSWRLEIEYHKGQTYIGTAVFPSMNLALRKLDNVIDWLTSPIKPGIEHRIDGVLEEVQAAKKMLVDLGKR